jgi:hypothetical protein
LAFAAIVPMLVWPLSAGQAGQRALEYEVKAAFLVNFVRFVEWPAEAGADAPFVVCVGPTDPFGNVLDRTVTSERLGDRRLTVRRLREPVDPAGCGLLFLTGDSGPRIVASLRSRTSMTLLVGERDRFLDNGGHINFVMQGGHVRFDLNVASAAASGLVVSSKLARVARRVVGGERGQ